MREPIDVEVYFNFRSPYCYLVSKTMWPIFEDFHTRLIWYPVGGWSLRSSPERAKKKLPIARQDMARFAKRLGIPVNPPPMETEPTPAGAASLWAETQGKLQPFIVETMREEWEFGNNIATPEALKRVAQRCGLNAEQTIEASENPDNLAQLEANAERADRRGVIGVPSFVIGEEIFWGQDRVDFVIEALTEQRARRI